MTLTELTPPVEEPLSLAALKEHLRVDVSDDDDLILQIARTAREHIEALLDLALVSRDWRLVIDDWPELPIKLVRGPVQGIIAISVVDASDQWQVLPQTDYRLFGQTPGLVEVSGAKPIPGAQYAGIRIDFTAGFGGAAETPAPLKHAINLLTAHYYERREPFENNRVVRVPETVAALLAPFRRVRL